MNLSIDIFIYILWTVVRMFFNLIQSTVWLCNGTLSHVRNTFKEDSYQNSVQVLNIVARHKFCVVLQPCGVENFIATHRTFVNPEYVLQDHVTLYHITQQEAVFVETDTDVNVSLSNHGSFLRLAQFNFAKRLLIMPLHAFHKLGEDLGAPKEKVIFLGITARCGSTLVTQVFEETGSSVTYSEPDAINVLTRLKNTTSKKERIQIFRNCINVMCKPCQRRHISSYFFKLNVSLMSELAFMLEACPQGIVLFLYRDGLACSKSLAKITLELPLYRFMLYLNGLSCNIAVKFIQWVGLCSQQYGIKVQSRIQFGANIWCRAMRHYIDFKRNGMRIAALRYEDLVGDTAYAYQKMFEYCSIPYNAKAVYNAMKNDSQRGTPLSRKRLQKNTVTDYTEEIQKQTEGVCDQYSLPYFKKTFIAPGTVTYRHVETTRKTISD